jgi:hypothetical protein
LIEGQISEALRTVIADSTATSPPPRTRGDTWVPAVAGKAIAVVGMRRSGRTTFLWQLLADHLARGAASASLLFVNFEDDRLSELSDRALGLLLEECYRAHPELRERRVALFFDEIQVVTGWERFVRRVLDSERAEVLLSGSSARLLSREVATSMRGRALEALVHPFSFREYVRHLGREPEQKTSRLAKAQRSALERNLRNYLAHGGFPEAAGSLDARDRRDLLRSYVDVALLRDVIERHAVTHPVALRWLTRHLLGNAAGLFSVSKLYGNLRSQGLPVSKDTLHAYLAHLEDAFLVRTLSVTTGSERRRMVNPRKIYPIDPGLIPLFDRAGRANLGHALETCVLLELECRGADVGYVRAAEGFDVDFLAHYADSTSELIQVCADLETPEVRERELRVLEAARGEHRGAAARVVSLSPDPPRELPRRVKFSAASGWLLGD